MQQLHHFKMARWKGTWMETPVHKVNTVIKKEEASQTRYYRDMCTPNTRIDRNNQLTLMQNANLHGKWKYRFMLYGKCGKHCRDNILVLQRCGLRQDGSYGLIDDLTIEHRGNQLLSVADKAQPPNYAGAIDFRDDDSSTAEEYTYDGNGSLTSDRNRGIAKIEYDDWNNPRRIQFTNGCVTEYEYTASGEKLRVTHYTAVPNIAVPMNTTHELTADKILSADTTDYYGNLILRNGKPEKFLFVGGYVQLRDDRDYNPVLNALVHYYNTDHLGNVREVVNEEGEVEQVNNYYPFGAPFSDGNISAKNPSLQPYKYTGKELGLTHGLNTYDHGARQNYSLLGVWDRVDPMAEECYNLSPYTSCNNNPIECIDINGKAWTDYNGNIIKNQNSISVYIYYSDDFKDQAKKQYQLAEKVFGEGTVAWSNTDTRKNFKEDWSNIGKGVSAIIIMTHGKNQSIALGKGEQVTSTGNGKTNILGSEALDVTDLPMLNCDMSEVILNLYSCHSCDYQASPHGEGDHYQGALAGSMQPIAEAFEARFNFKYVKGTDGAVNYYSILKLVTTGIPYPESGNWFYALPQIVVYGKAHKK